MAKPTINIRKPGIAKPSIATPSIKPRINVNEAIPPEPQPPQPRPKKPRVARKPSRKQIINEACLRVVREVHPISGRGVGYRLLGEGLIRSMSKYELGLVYTALVELRLGGEVPWSWIVDDGRPTQRTPTWVDVQERISELSFYQRDHWTTQPHRVLLWLEKGTIKGVLDEVITRYQLPLLITHGSNSWTVLRRTLDEAVDDGRKVVVLYCGDWDPSGAAMSQSDIPSRLAQLAEHGWGSADITVRHIAATMEDLAALEHLSIAIKPKDNSAKWYRKTYRINRCLEVDALEPSVLAERVEQAVAALIDWRAWRKSEREEQRERETLAKLLDHFRDNMP